MTGPEPKFSIVVPTFNMGSFLQELWKSLSDSGLLDLALEVIFVDDGSTDDTRQRIEAMKAEGSQGAKVKLKALDLNQGRFLARKAGALLAKGERILFVDSRVQLHPTFKEVLQRESRIHRNLIPSVEIDEKRGVFSLYWKRSHQFIFREHFKRSQVPVQLTPENFESMLKGTTALFCDTKTFVKACSNLGTDNVLNDDTRVLEAFVKIEPITIHPDLKIVWVPRETAMSFLARLWSRGPSFTEYHVILHRDRFFWIVLIGVFGLAGLVVLGVFAPWAAVKVFCALILAAVVSVGLFAKSLCEAFRMAPLHISVIVVFGTAILWGLVSNLARADMRKALFHD